MALMGPLVATYERYFKSMPYDVKGIDTTMRPAKMQPLMDYEHFFETDYARFDMTLGLSYLFDVEFTFLHMVIGDDIIELLILALFTKGVSEFGIYYTIWGTRCSGDCQTSVGNKECNNFNNELCTEMFPNELVFKIFEGDDGLTGSSNCVANQLKYNYQFMQCLGFQIKLDHYQDITLTSFCGRFNYDNKGSLGSYCDLKRTLAKLHTSVSDGDAQSLLLAKCMSYHYTDRHTPIIGPLTYTIINLLIHEVSARRLERAFRLLDAREMRWRHSHFTIRPQQFPDFVTKPVISAEIRAAVAVRTGWTPAMQVRFEEYYSSWRYIPSIITRIPDEWTYKTHAHLHGPVSEMVL